MIDAERIAAVREKGRYALVPDENAHGDLDANWLIVNGHLYWDALDRLIAFERAEAVLEGWDKSGWPHNYIPPGGIHNSNCWACDEMRKRQAALEAAMKAIEDA